MSQLHLFDSARGIPISAWDVLLVLAALFTAVRPVTWRGRAKPLDMALVAVAAGLLIAVLWGAAQGGDLRQAYYQVQALVRTLVLTHVLLGLFRTSRHLVWLGQTILLAAMYRAVSCILYFFLYLDGGRVWPYPDAITNHADSALWATAVIGVVAWVLALPSVGRACRAAPPILAMALAVYYNNRRLAWVQVVGGLLLLYLVMPPGRAHRRVRRWAVLALPFVLLYVAVGWQRPYGAFSPVAKIRSVVGASEDDSSRSRDIENVGLIVTLQRHRLLGTGFGHPYQEVSGVYSAGMSSYFQQYLYIPHNSLLGLASWTGLLLFPVIWCVHPVVAFLAARASRWARRPRERALAMAAFAVPFVYAVQAFGDMGIQMVSVGTLLASSMACAGRLAVLTGGWPVHRRGRGPRLRLPPTPETIGGDPPVGGTP